MGRGRSESRHHSSSHRHSHHHGRSRSRSRSRSHSRSHHRHSRDHHSRSHRRDDSRHRSHHSSHRSRSRDDNRHKSPEKKSSSQYTQEKGEVLPTSTISMSFGLSNTSKPIEMKPMSLVNKKTNKSKKSASISSLFETSKSVKKQEEKKTVEKEEDPYEAFMREIDKETKQGVEESLIKDIENQIKFDEEEEMKKNQSTVPLSTITIDEILNATKTEEKEEEKEAEEDDDVYYEQFREAMKKKKEEEEKEFQRQRIERKMKDTLGYTEMQDDYVEEYLDDNNEISTLEQLQKRIQRRILEPVDHSKMNYIPIRKDFYIESPLIAKMTDEEVKKLREEWRMIIRGRNYPKPVLTWAQCGLTEKILFVINKLGYTKPFPIQAQAIPTIMTGREVIAVAKTGSGKTLGYLLPLFRHILDQPPIQEGDGPIGLILAPSRELCAQIYNEANKFCKSLGIRCTAVYGGTSTTEQINSLKRGSEIIVCTPGRMIEILSLNQGRLVSLRRVSYVVLDEADRMLDMGFEPQIQMILQNVRPDRQLVMFSATFPTYVESMARKILVKPIMIVVGGRTEVAAEVSQIIEVRTKDQKYLRLLELLGTWYEKGLILIFVDKQQKADCLFRDLFQHGYFSKILHGGMDQQDRDEAILDFKNKVFTILIATSVAGRGLHVKDLVLVINYDCPNHLEDYVHRVGRTGRAGNKGTAITFITPQEDKYAGDMVKALKQSNLPVPEDLQKLYDSFEKKVKEGNAKHHYSGYATKGFKFDEAEAGEKEVLKNMQKRQMQIESGLITEEEAQQQAKDEITICEKYNIKIDNGMKKDLTVDDEDDEEYKREVFGEEIENILNNEDGTINKESIKRKGKEIMNALGTEGGETIDKILKIAGDRSEITSNTLNDALKAMQSIDDSVQAKKGIQMKKEKGREFFFEEIDINDYPQKARFALNNRVEMDRIQDWTGATVGIRGNYVPPGRRAASGTRRLYLYIEADARAKVTRAKTECLNLLEGHSKNAYPSEMMN